MAGVQREMVEKRIERVREKEKSILYKAAHSGAHMGAGASGDAFSSTSGPAGSGSGSASNPAYGSLDPSIQAPDATTLSEAETARIEAQLSPEQLQLFAEENDTMLKHYEDTLGKVQYVISSPSSFSYFSRSSIPISYFLLHKANSSPSSSLSLCLPEMPKNHY